MSNNKTYRILLAEDEKATRSFLELMLTKAGYDVVACEDGVQAFAALVKKDSPAFDLLLTDVVMPQMDGIELTQKALAYAPKLKVLYITGFAGAPASSHTTKNGDNLSQVIPKPFHMNEILDRISALLEKGS